MAIKVKNDALDSEVQVAQFVNDATNAHTRRARRIDMTDFVITLRDVDSRGKPRCAHPAYQLIHQPPDHVDKMLAQYREILLRQKLAPSTINRRFATLRAWVRYAQKAMLTGLSLDDINLEVVPDHDSCGQEIHSVALAELCAQPDVLTLRGLRDAALLHLMCEVPLLGWQLCSLRVENVLMQANGLQIPTVNAAAYSDGNRRSDNVDGRFVSIKISPRTTEVIREYLVQNQLHDNAGSPLFVNFDRCPSHAGVNLVPKSILHLVKEYGKQIGIHNLNPRTIRASVIVRTLEEANWKVSVVRRRFPHVGLHTWFRYARDF